MNQIDFEDEAQVAEYLTRIGIEYRFQCFHEGLPDGCHRLADWLVFGHNKDFKKAGRVFKASCDLYNYGHSCFNYGSYAFLGKGRQKDADVAGHYWKKSCEGTPPYAKGCANYGTALLRGDLSNKGSLSEARGYFERGCGLGDGPSCLQAFGTYFMEGPLQDKAKGVDFLERGCRLGDYGCCINSATAFEKGDGVEADPVKAAFYQDKAKAIEAEMDVNKPNVTFGK